MFNKGNLAVLDEIVSPDFTVHDAAGIPIRPGRDGVIKRLTVYRAAFPNLEMVVNDALAEGDKVSVRWTFSGTHSGGPYLGVTATGKKVSVTGQSTYRIAGGRMVEAWINSDDLGEQQQLGLLP
jgi:predicted ester cyclase